MSHEPAWRIGGKVEDFVEQQPGPGHETTFDCKDRAWKNYALCRKYGPGSGYAPTFQ